MEHIECELSALVALCGGIVKITEVGGNAGYAENAGLLVEDIEHLIYADTVLVHDKLDNTCVEIAAASAHRQTYQRSEAHGCVNTLAAVDCGDRAAVAHVAGDDLKLLDGLAHQLCAAAGDIAVARAVEAVAADAVVLIILIRNSVHEGLAGHGLMESGVENCDHGDIAHDITAGIDADDVCGIVQGGKGGALLESLHDLVCDEDGGSKLLTAVNDTVADSVNLLHGADNAVLGTGKLVNNRCNCLGVSGHGKIFIENGLAAYQRTVLEVAVDADTLAETLSHYGLGLHIDQLVLQRGAACVDNKNLHYKIPFLL